MEFNKIFASILVAALVATIARIATDHIYHVDMPAKKAYVVEGVAQDAGAKKVAVKKEEKLPAILPLLASADIAKGQKLTKKCAACHSFDNGGPNKVGPNLYNIVGAKLAAKPGFSYSPALVAKGGNWGYEELNAFLYKPKKFVKGTKMAFAGLKKEKDRANMIAYLRSLSASPKPLK